MATVQFGFQPLDLRNATESEYECLSKFKNILNREYDPDDPPIPLEEHIQGWKNIPNFVEHEVYIVWNSANTEIIANCEIAVYNTGDNEHLADFTISLPRLRRGDQQRLNRLAGLTFDGLAAA